MARVLVLGFAIGAFLDLITAIFGFIFIFRAESTFGYMTCIFMAVAFLCMQLCAEMVFSRSGRLYFFMKCCVILTVLLTLYAVFVGVAVHIVLKQPLGTMDPILWQQAADSAGPMLIASAIALMCFLVASPCVLSYLMKDHGTVETT